MAAPRIPSARPPLGDQPDLLDWTPPQAEIAFDHHDVRSASPAGRIARAVAVALRDCGRSRTETAAAMSEYLGERVPPAMMDAYASVARTLHQIPLTRFLALVHATRDRRLLQMLAEPMGWAVVERRHLPLIAAAQIREREDALKAERKALVREAKRQGAL
jgi:hypothetical protein